MKDSEYTLACNIKGCLIIRSELNEMTVLDSENREMALEASRIVGAILENLNRKLIISDENE